MKRGLLKRGRESQAGLTLVELLITAFVVVTIFAAFARLVNDYMLTAKTLNVTSDASTEMMRLLKNITSTFQRSLPDVDTSGVRQSRERGCVLQGGDGMNIDSYSCTGVVGGEVRSTGVGFKLDSNNRPAYAYVNGCESIPDNMIYPSGRVRFTQRPEDLSALTQWGSLNKTCPASCPEGQRPVVRFLDRESDAENPPQVPKRILSASDSSALYLWGAVLCASYFKDEVRDLQRLYGDNVAGFLPNYLNVTSFIARGRFDFRPTAGRSAYVWTHGGTVLEFNSTQELSTYRCKPGQTGDRKSVV